MSDAPVAALEHGEGGGEEAAALSFVAPLAEREEGLLRALLGEIPAECAQELAEAAESVRRGSLSPAGGALRRFAVCRHYHRRHVERQQEKDPEARQAMHDILSRRPVVVVLSSGRRVEVTSRGYAALYNIAAHQKRIRLLEVELDRAAEEFAGAEAAVRTHHSRAAMDVLRAAEESHRRHFAEMFYQRGRLYANLLTPDGSSAREDAESPDWWGEITPEDDARLLAATIEVGPMRLERLGPAPANSDAARKAREDWGWEAVFAVMEPKLGVEPASLRDTDLAAFAARLRLRASVDPASDDEEA